MAAIEKPVADRRFEHLLLDFLAYLEFERGLSRNTLEAYRTDLFQFGRFLERARGLGARCGTERGGGLPRRPARRGGAEHPPASPATIHRKSACLRSFYRHLRRDGLIEADPAAAISSPRRARKLPRSSRAERSSACLRSRGAVSRRRCATVPCSS